MKPIRIAALVVIGAAVVALAGVGRPELAGGASKPSGGITVTGTGTVQSRSRPGPVLARRPDERADRA